MLFALKSFGQYFRTYPLRGILTIITIAIGTAALVVTFSLSLDVSTALDASLSQEGRRIVIANATLGDDGEIERQIPPGFDGEIAARLAADYENLRDVTYVGSSNSNRVSANGTSYQIRSVISTGPEYVDLMDLDLLAGSYFTQSDIDNRRAVVVLSESTARIMFGDAEGAVGQDVLAAVPTVGTQGSGQRRVQMTQQAFSVIGVFGDVSELARDAFGVGDMIIPLGLNRPALFGFGFDPSTVVMARLVDAPLESATARIGAIAEVEYDDQVLLSVWEGSPSGPAPLIEESRKSVSSFGVTVNVLGVIVLVASSIGIFSIMLVEVLNRLREIGLRRALGATRAGIRRFFMAQAVYFSLIGSLFGTALAFVFYRMIGSSLAPFFESSGLSAEDLDLVTPGVVPIVLAVGAAVVLGAAFGFFPAISASRTPIVECIREDAG